MNRIFTAYALQKPDRSRSCMPTGHFLAQWGGITRQELTENADVELDLLTRGWRASTSRDASPA